jgi:phosphoribosylamine-glycine ligase
VEGETDLVSEPIEVVIPMHPIRKLPESGHATAADYEKILAANMNGVREHYRTIGLTDRLKIALTVVGPEDQPLTPQQLGALDHFHTRGLAATAGLAQLARISADMSVLDVG